MWGIPLNVPQFDDFEEMFLGIQDPRIPFFLHVCLVTTQPSLPSTPPTIMQSGRMEAPALHFQKVSVYSATLEITSVFSATTLFFVVATLNLKY